MSQPSNVSHRTRPTDDAVARCDRLREIIAANGGEISKDGLEKLARGQMGRVDYRWALKRLYILGHIERVDDAWPQHVRLTRPGLAAVGQEHETGESDA